MNVVKPATLLLLCCASSAALSAGPDDLGKSLTPFGAERAGTADGSIPAWTGADVIQSGWSASKPRGEHFKFQGDKPLFSIDASNVDKYAANLTAGQVALIKKSPGYRMDVYPTRRTCSAPGFVADATRKNAAGSAALAADGWSLKSAMLPGVPFPIPKSGIEVIWNFKLRYRGIGTDIPKGWTVVSPRPGGGEWISAGWTQVQYIPWGLKQGSATAAQTAIEFHQIFNYTSPAALAGQALLVSAYTGARDNEVFYYFPGQRRVRRMPTYAYDAPQLGFENQYTVDQTAMYTGTPDRYDWKIVGKREIFIPYNNFGLYGVRGNLQDVGQKDSINPALRRYEKHRVWVVEGTLKSGVRHASPRRTFYFDEDSWIMAVAEDFDVQNALWKVRESYPIPVYETGACDFFPSAQYDMLEGRYLIDNLSLGSEISWVTESTAARFKDGYYTADNLRATSER